MTRRDFLFAAGAVAAFSAGADSADEPSAAGQAAEPAVKPAVEPATVPAAEPSAACQTPENRGIKLRFLGSGAAGWKEKWAAEKPDMRRQSSVLLDGRVLIDFTACNFDMLPEGCRPEVLFQTHSHGDHYSPKSAVKVGVARMYVHETWAAAAQRDVAAAAESLSLPAPKVIPVAFGVPVEECGMRFTAVPANHSTSRVTDGVLERTALYLVEKGESRLLYATDTGGIPGDAARMVGIDPHIRDGNYAGYADSGAFVRKPGTLTALVMEATDADLDDDFRMFVHSSVQLVDRTAKMLVRNGRLVPPEVRPVYLTHFGLRYRAWPAEAIEAELPPGLRAAYDGLEIFA